MSKNLNFNNELNLTSLVNKLTGLDAFVISSSVDDLPFQFNVNGYCFTTCSVTQILNSIPALDSDLFYLQVHVPMKNGLLVDREGTTVEDSSIVDLDTSCNISFSFSTTSTCDPSALICASRLVNLQDTNITTYQKGVQTSIFTLVQCCREGSVIRYSVPEVCKITSNSLLHLELSNSETISVDDGEL